MKTKLLFLLFFAFIAGNAFAQKDLVDEIKTTAQAGLEGYLEKIPVGQELFFGFKNRDEFKLAEIGMPFQVFTFNKEFFSDTILMDKNYLVTTGEWRVAVSVENDFRVMLTVAKMNGVWKAVGIGAATLAKELGEYEKEHSSTDQSGIILRVFQMDCDFLLTSPDSSYDNIKVYPLESAKIALNITGNADSIYTMKQLQYTAKKIIENK